MRKRPSNMRLHLTAAAVGFGQFDGSVVRPPQVSREREREHGFRWGSGHRNRWTHRVIRSQQVGAIVACVYRMGSLQDAHVQEGDERRVG